MRFIDLCAGIGGFSYGLEMAGMTCIAQVVHEIGRAIMAANEMEAHNATA